MALLTSSDFDGFEERSLDCASRRENRKRPIFAEKKRRDASLGMTKFAGRAEKMGSGVRSHEEINKAI